MKWQGFGGYQASKSHQIKEPFIMKMIFRAQINNKLEFRCKHSCRLQLIKRKCETLSTQRQGVWKVFAASNLNALSHKTKRNWKAAKSYHNEKCASLWIITRNSISSRIRSVVGLAQPKYHNLAVEHRKHNMLEYYCYLITKTTCLPNANPTTA